MKKPTLAELFEKYPPFLVRNLATVRRERSQRRNHDVNRKKTGGWRLLTVEEISKRSGIPSRTVKYIAAMTSWDDVNVGVALDFMRGCGFEMTQLQRVNARLRDGLNRQNPWPLLNNHRFLKFSQYALKKFEQTNQGLVSGRTSNSNLEKQAAPPMAGDPSALATSSSR